MLDSETRRRIDTARDILVGKVPDPKSQVEQITIALVYKFMDDMDKQSIEMGGKASFFKGKFAKYGWSNIFDPRLGGIEMLALYGEAITNMSRNENLPQLFRDIFKNAFLPYRDPETLKLFLKTINEFTYDHSEKLGDAFEYLLSVLGSQGDAGQFRTPRHIIDFMVKVVDPKKNDTVLDPACGTAGFLISAYKHIVKSAQDAGKPLSVQDKKQIYENFMGYDISPDMVRLSLVNLYLHGFVKPHIYEYDTLTSEERWSTDYASVILANPPFMSPKGGIQPHKRFSVQSNRSEVLFVDYMAEHLTPNGRAAIIVPEGIIFQSAGAYKQLRKYLVEQNYLWAVVSLPAGVFNPYAGVKTSILFLDRALAKKTDQVLFVKLQKDGYDPGAQRRALCNDMGDKPELCPKHSDLPDALNTLRAWHKSVLEGTPSSFKPIIGSALLVSTAQLAENEDYNLSADRYREVTRSGKHSYPKVRLGEVCERVADNIDPTQFSGDVNYIGLENIESNTGVLVGEIKSNYENIKSAKTKFVEGDILYGKLRPNLNKVYLSEFFGICSTDIYVLRATPDIDERYLSEMLRSSYFNEEVLKGLSGSQLPRVSFDYLAKLQIPLPSLEIQRQIADEIAAHQRIIDGARQVVEGWKPNIELELAESLPDGMDEWEKVELGKLCENLDSQRKPVTKSDRVAGKYPYYGASGIVDYVEDYIFDGKYLLVSEDGANLLARVTPIAFSVEGKIWVNNHAHILKFDDPATQSFVEMYLNSIDLSNYITGSAQPKLNQAALNKIPVPLPPLDIQREIVTRIERERSIVEGNRELIRIYEEKVKKVIERVWEG